ncbi:MAG: peptidase M61 [Cyclobacteriaceae bacterium]
MIRIFLLSVLSLIILQRINAQSTEVRDKYVYTVDITKVVDDKLQIELLPPATNSNSIVFFMPKIIPGTYRVADFGRFVSDFKAFDIKNKELPVKRLDNNSWKIGKVKKLHKISYWVEDTYDTDIEDNFIYPMAGTNIEAGKNVVFNTHAFFGYFDGMLKTDYQINIVRPEDFYGSTGLVKSRSTLLSDMGTNGDRLVDADEGLMVDTYDISDYQRLVDSPMMYNVPDTTILKVANTEVLISTYTQQNMVNSKMVAENVEQILLAAKDYLGGELPVEKYAFIYYFEDYSKTLPIQGALEHSYSSYYYFPEVPFSYLSQSLKDVAAHEFFHIVTPLNIHSEEIEYFDFNEPQMSKHLWLYEGITEYFSDNAQIKYDIISPDDYLAALRSKIINSANKFNDTLSFTQLSKQTLDLHKDQYGNVYEKGALIGMCLDIKLRDLSDGKYGLQDLIAELSDKFGKERPFHDEELFDVITEMTYPEINEFFQSYIIQGGVLPYEAIFESVGVNYFESAEGEAYSLGFTLEALSIDTVDQKIKIVDADQLNDFGKKIGFKTGDLLLKINGQEIPDILNMVAMFEKELDRLRDLDELSYTVLRKSEEGESKEVLLKTPVERLQYSEKHALVFKEFPSDRQLRIRNNWLKPN